MVKSVVVVGGGAAGWITAGLIAAKHITPRHSAISVTLVESPTIGILGVGEGTWPTMGQTLQRLGISETEFIQKCDASFKQGTKFQRWVTGEDSDCYYHPFSLPQGFEQISLHSEWRESGPRPPFAQAVCLQPELCEQKRAPKQVESPEYASVENYGYHLDANKFAKLLSEHCKEKLGVKHVLADINAVNSAENGDIISLSSKQGIDIAGDLFIDCSGGASLLIGKHYKVPFLSKKDILFIDKALAVQIPYANDASPIESTTISTAQTSGWIWDIGLATRRGVGHVFSSQHISVEDATAELKAYLRPHVEDVEKLSFRELSFNPGYREQFWVNNCVAVGMSAGFLEPLEASALIMVELAANTISLHMPASREGMDVVAKLYNERFLYRWDRIIDFLKLHYVLSKRTDSAFWTDNRNDNSVPESLKDLLKLWRHQPPSNNGFLSPYDLFPAASYQYILYGMDFETEACHLDMAPETRSLASHHLDKVKERKAKIPPLLPSNRELLTAIRAIDLNGLLDIEKDDANNWIRVPETDIPRLAKSLPLFFRRNASSDCYDCIALLGLSADECLVTPAADAAGPGALTGPEAKRKNETALSDQLNNLGLLEPVKLDITLKDNSKLIIKGIHTISRSKLGALPSPAADRLRQDWTPFIQAILSSTQHVKTLIDKKNGLIAS